jgi:hypothetical protein
MESAVSLSGANHANPDRAETCLAQAPATPPPYADGHEALGYDNVLREIITDEQYRLLRQMGVLNEKALRDAYIRKTFKELRAQSLSAHQSIERLQTLYPYLQFDTIRKIVYQIN